MKLQKKLITALVGLADKAPGKLSEHATSDQGQSNIAQDVRKEQRVGSIQKLQGSQLAMVVDGLTCVECNFIPLGKWTAKIRSVNCQ